jgi:hypothetical protein
MPGCEHCLIEPTVCVRRVSLTGSWWDAPHGCRSICALSATWRLKYDRVMTFTRIDRTDGSQLFISGLANHIVRSTNASNFVNRRPNNSGSKGLTCRKHTVERYIRANRQSRDSLVHWGITAKQRTALSGGSVVNIQCSSLLESELLHGKASPVASSIDRPDLLHKVLDICHQHFRFLQRREMTALLSSARHSLTRYTISLNLDLPHHAVYARQVVPWLLPKLLAQAPARMGTMNIRLASRCDTSDHHAVYVCQDRHDTNTVSVLIDNMRSGEWYFSVRKDATRK